MFKLLFVFNVFNVRITIISANADSDKPKQSIEYSFGYKSKYYFTLNLTPTACLNITY